MMGKTLLMEPTLEQEGRSSIDFCAECHEGKGQGTVKVDPNVT